MQQEPKTPRLHSRSLRWGMLGLVIAALLVFAGAALAQETTPQPEAITEVVPKPAAGLVVIHVEADSPAAAAGVARGDIILAVDDDAVNTLAELKHVIASHDTGDVIVLKVMHGDEARSLSVTLGDNNGLPQLGVMAVGDLAVDMRMTQRGQRNGARPGRNGRQGDMPFGHGQPFGNGQMPGMPFGRGGQDMRWMDDADGALVMDISADGPAAAAGLQAGDVITGLNDVAVASSDELVALLGDHKPGDVVTVSYERDDASASTEVTLGTNPDDETKAYLGVQLAPAGPAPFRMEMPNGMMSGVMLVDVTADGPAAIAGLRKGDQITAVNGIAIETPQALADAVKAAKPGDKMVLSVQSVDSQESVDVTVTLGTNADGGALLGVQIGAAMRIQQGPGGMDFDFHNFHGQQDGQNGNKGMPQMPFFFGRPNQQDGGRGPAPGQDEQPAKPDARFSPQPDYATRGA